MTYKIGVSLFKDLYREAIQNAGVVPAMEFNVNQILLRESLVQAELGNTYKLVEKTQTIDLVLNQYEYTVGIGADDIKADILQIEGIFTPQINSNSTRYNEPIELTKCSIEEIQAYNREAGLPTKYAVILQNSGMLLVINSNPESYSASTPWNRLLVNYWQRLYTFNGTGIDDNGDSVNNNSTWSDYDVNEYGYGGEFKLPEDWHEYIVQGAVAKAMLMYDKGASLNIWNDAVQKKLARQNLKVNPHIKYQLGFSR